MEKNREKTRKSRQRALERTLTGNSMVNTSCSETGLDDSKMDIDRYDK